MGFVTESGATYLSWAPSRFYSLDFLGGNGAWNTFSEVPAVFFGDSFSFLVSRRSLSSIYAERCLATGEDELDSVSVRME